MSKTTTIFDYQVKITELFDNPKSSTPTRIKFQGESSKNWIVKFYKINGNFYEYMNILIPKFKKDILEMEKLIND